MSPSGGAASAASLTSPNRRILNQTVERLAEVSSKLNQVVSGIQNGEGSLGKLTKDEQLYKNLSETSANLNNLVKDIKENPKRYINISVFGKK